MNIEEMEWPLSKEELGYLYFDEDMTQKEIGEKFNRDDATVNYHYKKHNINCYGKGYRLRKSNKEFKKEVYEMVGDEYTFLEKYIKGSKKIKVKHNVCGKTYKVRPNSFLSSKRRCPYCSPSTPKTTKQFQDELDDKFNNEFKVLGKYKTSKDKIKIKHKVCGYAWSVSPDSILQAKFGCPKCGNKDPWNKKTHKEFVNEIKENGNKYEILGKYVDSKTKILVKHKKCGGIFKALPYNLLFRNVYCPKCRFERMANKQRKTNEEFLKELKEKYGDKYFKEYTILTNYINSKTKIKIRHNKCGRIYKVIPDSLLRGYGCRECSYEVIGRKGRLTQKQVKKRIKEKMGNNYKLVSGYKTISEEVKIKHLTCGKTFKTTLASISNSKPRCKYCYNITFSKPMQKIEKFLKENNIEFKNEFMFDDLIFKNNLRIDFYLKNKKIGIEYDGKQHFEPVDFFGGEEKFEIRKKLDDIKNKYCEKNDINLIRIPYWEKDNIEEILEEELKEVIKWN